MVGVRTPVRVLDGNHASAKLGDLAELGRHAVRDGNKALGELLRHFGHAAVTPVTTRHASEEVEALWGFMGSFSNFSTLHEELTAFPWLVRAGAGRFLGGNNHEKGLHVFNGSASAAQNGYANGQPVLLAPGLACGDYTLEETATMLESRGHTVYMSGIDVNVASTKNTVELFTNELVEIRRREGVPAIAIAHSKGGRDFVIAAIVMGAEAARQNIKHIVPVGSPIGVDQTRVNAWIAMLAGIALSAHFVVHRDELKVELHYAAMLKEQIPVPVTALFSEGDHVIDRMSLWRSGVTMVKAGKGPHISMPKDPEVLRQLDLVMRSIAANE